MKRYNLTIAAITMLTVFLAAGCFQEGLDNNADIQAGYPEKTSPYSGKKVMYVDSYHEGYEWSDDIYQGVMDVFEGKGIELVKYSMDTKRNTGEDFKIEAAKKAKELIDVFQPDVLITSDDNAFKYLVKEYYRDSELPVVFCGVNWDASLYGAPYSNTVGMIEVALIPQLIEMLEKYSAGRRIGFLADDTETSLKEADYPEKLFNITFERRLVSNFADWKSAFLEIQEEVDVLYLHNNAAINDWDEEEAIRFVNENTKVPTGAIYEWVMPYSLLGLTNSGYEEGEWSAKTALLILDGEKPSDIPIAYNKKGKLILNFKIAEKLDVTFSPEMIKNAEIVS